jgi:hypothetical protein
MILQQLEHDTGWTHCPNSSSRPAKDMTLRFGPAR